MFLTPSSTWLITRRGKHLGRFGAQCLVRQIETEGNGHVVVLLQHVVLGVRRGVHHLPDAVVDVDVCQHRNLGAPVSGLHGGLHVGPDFEQVLARAGNPGRKADRDALGRVYTKPNNAQADATACWRYALGTGYIVHRTIAR